MNGNKICLPRSFAYLIVHHTIVIFLLLYGSSDTVEARVVCKEEQTCEEAHRFRGDDDHDKVWVLIKTTDLIQMSKWNSCKYCLHGLCLDTVVVVGDAFFLDERTQQRVICSSLS